MRRLFLPLGLAFLISPLSAHAQTTSDQPIQAVSKGASEPTGVLTLSAAVQLALSRSTALAEARKEVEATDAAVYQASVRPNPVLSAEVEDTRRETRTSTVQIGIPLELGGKRSSRIKAAESGRSTAAAEFRAAQADVKASVIQAFFDVLIAQERVALATASADVASKAAEATGKRVSAGRISPVDETRARVAQANVELDVVQAKAELDAARYALAATWGGRTVSFSSVEADLGSVPAAPDWAVLQQRAADAPQLRVTRAELERRRALVDVERSRRYPDITVSIGAKRDEQLGRNQAIVGVSAPLPLFDRNQGSITEAMRRAEKAESTLLGTQIRLDADLRRASANLSSARTTVQALEKTVLPGAQQAYDAATRGFEAGKFNFLDVLDAQRTLFQARSQYLNALANAHVAATTIDRLLGN